MDGTCNPNLRYGATGDRQAEQFGRQFVLLDHAIEPIPQKDHQMQAGAGKVRAADNAAAAQLDEPGNRRGGMHEQARLGRLDIDTIIGDQTRFLAADLGGDLCSALRILHGQLLTQRGAADMALNSGGVHAGGALQNSGGPIAAENAAIRQAEVNAAMARNTAFANANTDQRPPAEVAALAYVGAGEVGDALGAYLIERLEK